MKIFFSGIGGVGIGPLAMIAQDAGYDVVGGDLKESLVTKQLQARGIHVTIGDEEAETLIAEHEKSAIDLLVYTAALPDNHPELEFARDNGIKAVKRHELINLLIKRKGLKMVAVSGTHGKTTTTSMLVWLFEMMSIPFSHSVGTTLKYVPLGRYQEGSKYFVYEADEFDKNFLNFHPDTSLITSISYDHSETFPDQESYDKAFAEFFKQSKAVIMWDKDTERFEVADSANITVLEEAIYHNHLMPNHLGLTLTGTHNRENASLIVEFATKHLKLPIENVVDTLNDYPGSDRRFEELMPGLYTDYAHHPDEIAATIELANELSEEVIVIYQPHQNSRQHQLYKDNGYKNTFIGARKVYWLPTFLSRENEDLDVLKPEKLSKKAKPDVDEVDVADMNDELIEAIKRHVEAGDLVVAMSAGDLDTWLRDKFSGFEQ